MQRIVHRRTVERNASRNRLCRIVVYILGALSAEIWAAQPRLVIQEPTHDFGTAPQGGTIEHRFVLRNEGDAPLTIKEVSTSCGCTAAEVRDRVIPPGGDVSLDVKLSLDGLSGEVRRSVLIQSNDTVNPQQLAWLAGVAKGGPLPTTVPVENEPPPVNRRRQEMIQMPPPAVDPPELVLIARDNEPVVRDITIVPPVSGTFRISSVEVPLTAVARVIPVAGGYRIRVQKLLVDHVALTGKKIVVLTDAPGWERIEIPLRVVQSGLGSSN